MSKIALPYNWEPRDYQFPLWNYFQNGGDRASIVWHRRAGKDLMAINLAGVWAHQRIGLYWHMLPTYKQGRKIVWNGATKAGRRFLDHHPKELVDGDNSTEMTRRFKNGSIYQVVGADDPDSLVGSNPVGVIFSEWSLMNPHVFDLIRPILSENEGKALFIFTPRGHNFAKELHDRAQQNKRWFSQTLTVDDTHAVDPKMIQDDREMGMAEAKIQQEYWCSFEAPIEGAYYASQMVFLADNDRLTRVPHEPLLPVYTSWDLGMDDSTTIWFFQIHHHEIRVIDYYENSGEGLPFYAKRLEDKHRKEYKYKYHYVPHDIKVRDLGTGKSRFEVLKKLGLSLKIVPKVESVHDRISDVRNVLPKCWIDKDKCERGIQCLRSYRKKYDENLQSYSTSPLHDWASHGADGFHGVPYATLKHLRQQSQSDLPKRALDRHSIF
jgi:hypothetical protein